MSKNNKTILQKIHARSGIIILIVAAVLIEVMGAVQYLFAENSIRKEVKQRARLETQVRSLQIQEVISDVEVAINNLQWLIDWTAQHPDSIYTTLSLIIQNNPYITGCAMAFEPNYFPEHGQWYEPFAGRENGLEGKIVKAQIGNADHDYHNAVWYREGLASTQGCWTEPYFDDAGSRMMVSSYTLPIHDAHGKVIGVFCSDLSLEWLADLFGSHNGAYAFLVSRSGRLLACPDKSLVMKTTIQEVAKDFNDSMIGVVNSSMLAGDSGDAEIRDNEGNKCYIYYAPVQGKTGWTMSIIFPDKEIYYELHRVNTWLTLFMILGFALLVYIMWRTIRGFKRLETVSAEKERIGSELRIASAIQMGMLPRIFPPYPDRDEVAVYGSLTPAKEVGGDLYDFYIRDGKLFFCIGDVSGKGVPASLVMAVTRSLFRTVSTHEDSPERVMRQMNNAMSEMNESSMFVTVFIGVLNLKDGELYYSNAGHCAPVLVGAGAPTVLPMDANIPVGLMPQWEYTVQHTTLKPGETIFLYTDGVTEAENIEHTLYGEERLMQAMNNVSGAPRPLIEAITNSVRAFVGSAEQSDDLTMLAVNFTKYLVERGATRSLVLHNDVQEVPRLAAFIEEVAEGAGLDSSTVMSLNLAMEEAVVNVMNYAYPEGTVGEVAIEASTSSSHLTFTISDSGTPFNPTSVDAPDTTLAAEDRPIGGLGIMLVKQLMDSVEYRYENNKNILTLGKKIH